MLGYHLVNILLHAASALLLVRIVRTLELPGAWLAGALFALHPVHVESVAWLSQLKNTLSGFLFLASTLLYLRFDRSRSPRLYAGALLLFLLGLSAKTAIATLPAGLLVVFWWKRAKLSLKKDVAPLLPLFVAGLLSGAFTAALERKLYRAEGANYDLSFLERFLVAGRAFCLQLLHLLWPVHLAFMYPRWKIDTAAVIQYLYPALAPLLLGIAWAVRRRSRAPLAGLLFFGGTLFPSLGFFNAYTFRYSFLNDHYQYLASLGLLVLLAAGFAAGLASSRFPRALGPPTAIVILGVLGFLTWRQARVYADPETLWRTTISVSPGSAVAHDSLALLLNDSGQTDEAISEYGKALAIDPNFPEAHNNLGMALARNGLLDEAAQQYQEALALVPGFPAAYANLAVVYLQKGLLDKAVECCKSALAADQAFAPAHNNLGRVLLAQGLVDEALEHFQTAADLDPSGAMPYYNLGLCYAQKHQFQLALANYRRALTIEPNVAAIHNGLANALLATGQVAESSVEFTECLRLNPELAEALNNLAWIRAACSQAEFRNGAEAVRLAEQACRLTEYKQALMVGTLGAAYAEAGRFDDAVRMAHQAETLALADGDKEVAARNHELANLYASHHPYRESTPPH